MLSRHGSLLPLLVIVTVALSFGCNDRRRGPGTDSGPPIDAATRDAPAIDAVTPDAPAVDAGPAGDAGMCSPAEATCDGLTCSCCPIGGPGQTCICSTPCTSSAQCTDSSRPLCNVDPFTEMGFCTATDFFCCWGCD